MKAQARKQIASLSTIEGFDGSYEYADGYLIGSGTNGNLAAYMQAMVPYLNGDIVFDMDKGSFKGASQGFGKIVAARNESVAQRLGVSVDDLASNQKWSQGTISKALSILLETFGDRFLTINREDAADMLVEIANKGAVADLYGKVKGGDDKPDNGVKGWQEVTAQAARKAVKQGATEEEFLAYALAQFRAAEGL